MWLMEQHIEHGGSKSRAVEGMGAAGAAPAPAAPGRPKERMVVEGGEAVWTSEPEPGSAARDALFRPGGTAAGASEAGRKENRAALASLLGR